MSPLLCEKSGFAGKITNIPEVQMENSGFTTQECKKVVKNSKQYEENIKCAQKRVFQIVHYVKSDKKFGHNVDNER